MRGFPSRHYVTFRSLHEAPLTIAARLMVPEGRKSGPKPGSKSGSEEKSPAVLILHGSAGPSTREGGYAEALHAAGFVTLEPDQWACRGLGGGSEGRPKTVVETLPDVFGARAYLAAHPAVDPKRIAVMGFSFGGVASMLAATHAYSDRFSPDAHFAAFMPVYPACWTYNTVPGHEFAGLVDAPLLLVTGALDEYDDDAEAGASLVASLSEPGRARVRTHAFADSHHCFDMPGVDVVVEDPMSHRGAGGKVIMRHNAEATARSNRLCVEFFREALG